MTREEQILELRRSFVDGQTYEIEFNKYLWRGKERKRNCLAYALNLVNGEIYKSSLTNFLSEILGQESKNEYPAKEIYGRFIKFFELIGVNYRKCSFITKVPKGHYKIAMLIETEDVHWLRQDKDGTWSHKPGWKFKPQNRDKQGRIIRNPRRAKIAISGKILEVHYFLIAH